MGSMDPSEQLWNAAVDSVELPRAQPHPVGIAHYNQILKQRQYHEAMREDSVRKHRDGTIAGGMTDIDDASQSTRPSVPDPDIDYTKRPAVRSKYINDIYSAATYSSAVCLAIIRIAEKNLPSIDFCSAINQLPNLAPTDVLPALPPGTFTGSIPHAQRQSNIPVSIAFLPEYYTDYRHALGYYCHIADPGSPGRTQLTAVVFTPCTTGDLEDWDMLRYELGKESDGVHGIDVVGVEGGRWLNVEVETDVKQWNFVFDVTMRWEKRVSKTLVRFMGNGEAWSGNAG